MTRRRFVFYTVLFTASLVACGTSSPRATGVISAGQVDIQLPPGWKVTSQGVQRPAPADTTPSNATVPSRGPVSSGGPETTAIPLAKEDPMTAFFAATTKFSQCLKNNGVKFIGVPDAKNPSSPANDPNYIKSLTTCAAQSNILQAMKDATAAQDSQTPAQTQKSNETYLLWRGCMIGKGWQIPTPKPDSKGRLFAIGSTSGGAPQFVAPPGQDILTSSDVRDCATQAQKKATP